MHAQTFFLDFFRLPCPHFFLPLKPFLAAPPVVFRGVDINGNVVSCSCSLP